MVGSCILELWFPTVPRIVPTHGGTGISMSYEYYTFLVSVADPWRTGISAGRLAGPHTLPSALITNTRGAKVIGDAPGLPGTIEALGTRQLCGQ